MNLALYVTNNKMNWFIYYDFIILEKIQVNRNLFCPDPVSCKVSNIKTFHPQIFIEISYYPGNCMKHACFTDIM